MAVTGRAPVNWPDERYVRLYTRDTPDWLALSFEAQALFALLIRKVDRSGVLELGKHGKRAVAVAIGHASQWERLEPALDELFSDGCVFTRGDTLIVRNFIEAQEARQSDRMRQALSRARRRDQAGTGPDVTKRDVESQNVTASHTESHAVTSGHTESHDVTPCLAVLSQPKASRVPAKARGPSADACEVAAYLLGAIRSHKPDARDSSALWAKDIDKAIRIDGRTPARLRAAIDFAHRNGTEMFWRANLLSGAALREQCERLEIQAASRVAAPVRPGAPTTMSVTAPVRPYRPPVVAEPVAPDAVRDMAKALLANMRGSGE